MLSTNCDTVMDERTFYLIGLTSLRLENDIPNNITRTRVCSCVKVNACARMCICVARLMRLHHI